MLRATALLFNVKAREMGTVKGVNMTEFNRKTIKAIFENAGLEVPPKDVLTELCDLHQQNGSEKDDRIKELEASLAAAEQERDALKEANGDGFKQKYEDEHKKYEDLKNSIAEEKSKAAKAAAAKAYFAEKGLTEKGINLAMAAAATIIDKLTVDGDKFKDTAELDKEMEEGGLLNSLIPTTTTVGANVAHPPATVRNAFESLSLSEKMRYANEHPSDQSVKDWLNK